MSNRRAGFTLVELLVVIGIIAVLIGLLLPALTGARRSANAVKCAAQLRDLGNAVQIYANENQYAIPTQQSIYKVGAKTVKFMWYDQLAKYVFKTGLAQETAGKPGSAVSVINDPNFGRTAFVGCPAFAYLYYPSNALGTATGYGLSLIPLAPAKIPVLDSDSTFVLNQFPATLTAPARYFKISEFKNPSNRALMADANGFGGIQAKGEFGPDPMTYYTPQPSSNVFGDLDYFRHGKRNDFSRPSCNVLFADMHVDLCTPLAAGWAIRDPSQRANRAN